MAASPANVAANRANSLKSCGPKSVEGKEAARRNALKHGLTGQGVVISGEDEHEVAIRVAALEAQLVPEGDVLAALLVRQVAISSIRSERAFRNETALAAERMRKAGDVYDDERLARAQQMLGEISLDPVTVRRRLMVAPEGVDALIERFQALRERTDTTRHVAWDEAEGTELDQCMGHKPGQAPLSRGALLTRGIAYNYWVGLDPAEFEAMSDEPRLHWAVAEVRAIIDAEIRNLKAHRAALDTTRRDRGHAEAAERALLDLGKEGIALRRYAGAAERTMFKTLQELRLHRAEAQAANPVAEIVSEIIAGKEVAGKSASFCTVSHRRLEPDPRSVVGSVPVDQKLPAGVEMVDLTPHRPGSLTC